MSKFYLTTPIYYVNAKPHIGHAYTTVAADVIARHQKQKLGAENVFFLTGTDEHGVHIADAAQLKNKSPKEFCDEMVPYFKKSWDNLGIDFTHFIRTTDSAHKQGARNFLTALKEKDALYEGEYKGLYCRGCESFLTEKDLDEKGNCPHHQRRPELVSEKNWFFKLNRYLDAIYKAISTGAIAIEPEIRKVEVLGLFKQGMNDFSISRPNVSWGIPLPWDENQTIYVWVEALLNYWTALFYPEGAREERRFWPPDLQLVGKDIIKFHCIYWPALLLAYYNMDTTRLPKKIFAHGFFTVNGQKMSKTVGNVISPNELTRSYGIDGARYLILTQFPFGADGDIEQSKFTEKYNAGLANGIGNLASRVEALIAKHSKAREQLFKVVENEYAKRRAPNEYALAMDVLQLFEALQIIQRHTRSADEFLAKNVPWKMDSSRDEKQIIEILAEAVASILVIRDMILPFMPQTAINLAQKFTIDRVASLAPTPLFPRL